MTGVAFDIFLCFEAGVPFLITAELFKQSHRPAAYTVGGSLNWMSNFTIGFIFPFLQVLLLLSNFIPLPYTSHNIMSFALVLGT